MTDFLQYLLDRPDAPQLLQEAQTALASERQRRQQFYADITEQEKAEFINGEVVTHSPVRLRHNVATKNLLKLLDTFVEQRQLGFVGVEKILIRLTRNDYEPDLCYFGTEKAAAFEPGQMFFPAPDLVVEVLSEGTAARDRGVKYEDYAAHGIGEYWIIDPEAEYIEQHLPGPAGRYELYAKLREGTLHSQALPGFALPVRALFDAAANAAALRAMF